MMMSHSRILRMSTFYLTARTHLRPGVVRRYNLQMLRTCTVTVTDPVRRTAHTTMAASLFEAVANALHWWEMECKHFGTGRRIVRCWVSTWVAGEMYRVKVGRVREWIAFRYANGPTLPLDATSDLQSDNLV
jgi:hypothetical protein